MALSIKTDEADELARALAAETHESLTTAVTVALRERLERVRRLRVDYAHTVARLQTEYARLTVDADPRTDEELIGYDESGLPG